MITEISLNKKRVLIITCIICALLIHLAPLRVRIYTKIFEPFGKNTSTQLQQFNTQKAVKPLMLKNQIPDHVLKQLHALRKQQKQVMLPEPAPSQQEQPKPLIPPPPPPEQPQPQPQPQVQTRHKIFRAGTGFDAPITDNAIAPTQQQSPKKRQQQQEPEKTPERKPTPVHEIMAKEKESGELTDNFLHTKTQEAVLPVATPEIPEKIQQHTPIAGRLALKKHAPTDETVKVPIDETPAPEPIQTQHEHKTRTTHTTEQPYETNEQQSGLSFLSPENFEKIIREQINLNNSDDSSAASHEYAGSFYGASSTHNQYGDPRFLHYNSKIYHALQQSMSIIINSLSATQYRTALDGVRNPTRIRFALDQDGNIISIVIARSSGNMRYDNLSYKIVQDASYPSIPKSFGLTRTYHQYGILLYDIGPGPHQNIGVSPYLEGE